MATEKQQDNWIKEGRGQGYLKSYKPWVTVRDFDWNSSVTDIREQYPLPLQATTQIAEQAQITHPRVRNACSGLFHCDRGSQYTSRALAKKASQLKMRLSMSDVGCCYDNAVVERFFGSLKHEGLGHTASMNEMVVKQEITQFIHYYNFKRPHTANNGMSPLEYENSQIKVSCAA